MFVTTDPWRDNAKVLRAWLDKFHPPTPYVGLTGTPTQLAAAEVAMGMPVATRKPAPKSYGSGKYSVSHFAGVLVYGRDNRLATIYPGLTAAAPFYGGAPAAKDDVAKIKAAILVHHGELDTRRAVRARHCPGPRSRRLLP